MGLSSSSLQAGLNTKQQTIVTKRSYSSWPNGRSGTEEKKLNPAWEHCVPSDGKLERNRELEILSESKDLAKTTKPCLALCYDLLLLHYLASSISLLAG